MKKALVHLLAVCPLKPSLVIVDAMPLNLSDTGYSDLDVHHFPKGENKSNSIAAASIIAKVRRDALITSLDPVFPGYQFARHKGYGTKIHQQALEDCKSSIIHRTTFIDNLVLLPNDEYEEQQTLF
jgi:ribonuclease HII